MAEVAVLHALGSGSIPVPKLVAHGCLDVHGVTWPYTVTTRLGGRSLYDVRGKLSTDRFQQVARTVGGWLRVVHEVPLSAELSASLPAWQPYLDEQLSTLGERLAAWGTLPDRLREQAPVFVEDVLSARRVAPVLVHSDVHDAHVLLTGALASGMIDFGDARLADPLFEFPPLVCGALGPDRRLLAAALDGYRLTDDERTLFARQALSLTLCHEGDLLAEELVTDVVHAAATLDELAEALYGH